MHIVDKSRIGFSKPEESGWRNLILDSDRTYFGDPPNGITRVIANVIHISDTHICDAQSPARVEFLDRYADPHNPYSPIINALVGTYRAHEMFTAQVLESMVQRINRMKRAPISLAPVDAVVATGDLTDNAQSNELDWFMRIMTGEKIRPDSGSRDKWEGFGGSIYSIHHWNPEGTPKGEQDDYPRSLYGFPIVPEVTFAVRAPFFASGLEREWFAIHGNHDALLQGTVVPDTQLRQIAIGDMKFVELSQAEVLQTLQSISEVGPSRYPDNSQATSVAVTPDGYRDFLDSKMFAHAMASHGNGHGYDHNLAESGKRYWMKSIGSALLIALDTVNPHGGWQGSIDDQQFQWLLEILGNNRDTYVIIASHHPLQDLINGYDPNGEKRYLKEEILRELTRFPNLVLWLAGHTHRNKSTYFGQDEYHGFWQVETSSLIDWPQQGRVVELFEDQSGEICIATTMFDHAGEMGIDPSHLRLDDVHNLAGLSRLLSANDWQRRGGNFAVERNEGQAPDRNAFLRLPARLRKIERAQPAELNP
ncbi:MAG: TIGR03767 family metallophosphoesterase [Actinobacteria bacterium]|jgi:metallophosphoesterase (TIGR03767 family)|nr:TIGR03767 family metallophosphoesterase [Actinomycetota bacterium]NDA38901.1 TIGR03767 family metallophosphoesterase [Actinomycetota bacterium]NDE83729.1 TIGR03767 family metallophosphoesterase [Actinomycetota bacterium]